MSIDDVFRLPISLGRVLQTWGDRTPNERKGRLFLPPARSRPTCISLAPPAAARRPRWKRFSTRSSPTMLQAAASLSLIRWGRSRSDC